MMKYITEPRSLKLKASDRGVVYCGYTFSSSRENLIPPPSSPPKGARQDRCRWIRITLPQTRRFRRVSLYRSGTVLLLRPGPLPADAVSRLITRLRLLSRTTDGSLPSCQTGVGGVRITGSFCGVPSSRRIEGSY